MRIDIAGGSATVGNPVVDMTGRVVAVNHVEARVYDGRKIDAYFEIAVSLPTGVFAVQSYGQFPPELENDEKYVFTVEVENDQYKNAKHSRFRLVATRPFLKTVGSDNPARNGRASAPPVEGFVPTATAPGGVK